MSLEGSEKSLRLHQLSDWQIGAIFVALEHGQLKKNDFIMNESDFNKGLHLGRPLLAPEGSTFMEFRLESKEKRHSDYCPEKSYKERNRKAPFM